MTYQLSLRNLLGHWWIALIHLAFLVGVPLFVAGAAGTASALLVGQIMLICFAAMYIPLLVLHLRYAIENKGMSFSYEPNGRTISVIRKGKNERFPLSELAELRSYKTRSLMKKSSLFFPWDSSCFSVLRFTDGQEFIITSLMVPFLIWPFDYPGEVTLPKVFCWPRKHD